MSDQVFLLPDLGEGLTEAEIVRWLVAVGDEVTVDQAIAEVETAKSIVEVPTPYAGRVAILHGEEGQTIGVDTPLITIAADGAGTAPSAASTGSAAAETYREEERAGSGNVLIGYGTSGGEPGGRRRRPKQQVAVSTTDTATPRTVPLVISPLVRALARDNKVALSLVIGSGPGGLIMRSDVVRASAGSPSPAPTVAGERRTPISGFRKTVATALARSRSEIPEATVWVDIDATELVALRENARLPDDPGPGLLTHLARFSIDALRAYPVLNGRVDTERDEFVEYDQVNLGLAVQSERGLVVPAVLGAETLNAAELDAAIRDLTARARVGKATAEELTAGTFTLNNYGSFNVDGSAAIINHPQVAIIGFGRIIDRPWVVNGDIVVRKIMQMSFVFDHRVCDGGTAAGFMRHIADAIENPIAFLARR
ncbi:dihydrolipoamide acetyltransferase family protein [Marmoricola sp. RAF53]|uniref:dihydrolipoamide acetyltransferase family protein n=1 Tax=Marmoricola sp. RAF53 TaxID=3233059 RepID=UPI003F94CE80